MKPADEFSNQPSRLGVFRRQERPGRQTEPALDTPTFLGTAGFRAGTAIDGPTAHNLRRSPEPDRILPEQFLDNAEREIAFFKVNHLRWPSQPQAQLCKFGVGSDDCVALAPRPAPDDLIGSLLQTGVPHVDHAWKQGREPWEEAWREVFVQ